VCYLQIDNALSLSQKISIIKCLHLHYIGSLKVLLVADLNLVLSFKIICSCFVYVHILDLLRETTPLPLSAYANVQTLIHVPTRYRKWSGFTSQVWLCGQNWTYFKRQNYIGLCFTCL